MGSGFSKMKKKAKQMQQQFSAMQEQMRAISEEGSSGSGLVKIILNGEKKIQNLTIDKQCVDPEDIEALEDLIISAYNDAFKKVEKKSSSGSAGVNLPF